MRATLQWGVRLTLAVVVAGIAYAAFSDGRPHGTALLIAFVSAVPAALAVSLVPAERLAAHRWRDAFFAGWSLLCIAQVTLAVALDGVDGPLATMFFLPLLFVVMSYPRWLVGVLGAVSVVAYLAVAVLQSGASPWGVAFYAIVLAWVSVFSLVATREQQRQRTKIAALSLRDPLTNLPNRTVLMSRLQRAVRGHAEAGDTLAVLFFDVDDFKVVNDSLGHPAGDSLLCQVVERLREGLRGEHLIARFGGDELVVVCERLRHPGEAVMIAERLAAAIRSQPFVLASGEHHVTASVGVAVGGGTGRADADSLIRDADAAMYRAKAAGRGRVEIFDDLLRRRIVDRVSLERDLRRALDAGELFVVYQPIIALGCPRPRVEALVRWRHPERGIVSPLDFIQVAEETGLIHELGEQVLLEACTQVAAWQREVPGLEEHRVSVNVSARQLADGAFPSRVASVLATSGLPAGSLVLEITESAVMDTDGAIERLAALRAMGVAISLDDFGTGHSSVTSLLRLPIIAIKLDRTFVADICDDPRQASVVRGLVALATDLGLHTIVEGVETPEQLELLRELGCENFQGYLFSRPVESGAYLDWVAAAAA